MKIGELAAQVGVMPSTLRYYERIGLLPKAARKNGRRHYDPQIIERLTAIRVAKQAGWELTEIQQLLDGIDGQQNFSEQWLAKAEAKLAMIDTRIAELEQMKTLLHRGIACACDSLASCELVQTEMPAPDPTATYS